LLYTLYFPFSKNLDVLNRINLFLPKIMKKQLISVFTLFFAMLLVVVTSTAQTTTTKKATPTDKKRAAAKSHYAKKTAHSTTTVLTVPKPKTLPRPAATPSKETFTTKGGASNSSRTGALKFTTTHYDFGTIKDGETFDYKFEFVNTGSKAINILDAKASCGCTVPEYPFVPIEPGEKGVIGVHYNSKTKAGQQHPLVTVTTDAPSTFQLHLEGFVDTKLIPLNH
jgi:Protein of unknown function (DUF1573)